MEKLIGPRYMLLGKIRESLQKYFGEGNIEVTLDYGDMMELKGIQHIRNCLPDGSFRLFAHDTEPSIIDLLNAVFRNSDDPPICDVCARYIGKDYLDQEEIDKRKELAHKYDIDKDARWSKEMKKEGGEPYKLAQEEWSQWVNGTHIAIGFIEAEPEADE